MGEENVTTASSINFINGKNPTPANSSHSTHRPPWRASTFADVPNSLRRRRGSTLSDSFDEARQSIRSSTDDLLLPRPKSPHLISTDQNSHWHSVPLALALLPALGGLFFHNGSAVITDLTLLGLAAVFLNWSVRLPWEWYHSAQSPRWSTSSGGPEDSSTDATIIEERSEDEGHDLNQSHGAENGTTADFTESKSDKSLAQSLAASELRFHELIALFTCFLFPLIGAWLLHTIRSQLSRPSEGLVSNYNLTVFLLAAELRPLAHLTKLVQARTLHLQRTLSPSLINGALSHEPQKINELSARLDDLEAHIAATATSAPNNCIITPTTAETTAEVRKSLQPDIDALNRAVRRYEKRATLLSMQTESRLQDLESRMADAITLAAAAERSNARKPRHGSALTILDWVCAAVILPVRTIKVCINFPTKIVRNTFMAVEGYAIRTVRKQIEIVGRGSGGRSGNGNGNYERKSTGKARATKKA